PRNQSHADATLAEHAQTMAIERVKAFEFLAVRAVPQASVGQYAIHVKDHHAQLAQLVSNEFGQLGQNLGFSGVKRGSGRVHHDQITFAANRSCMCRAPNSSPFASNTSIWLMRR